MNTKVNKPQNLKTKAFKKIEPPKLTKQEKHLMDRHIHLVDWHFKKLIQDNCTEISAHTIDYEDVKDADGKIVKAMVIIYIYGLDAMDFKTKQKTFGNFFIHFDYRVFQTMSFEYALQIQKIIEKEYFRDKYEEEIEEKRWMEQDKKKISQIKKVA